MTWFLRDDPVAAPAPPPQFADAQVPSRGDQFMAGMRKAQIEGNRWFSNELAEAELTEELKEALGGEEAIRPRNSDEMLDFQLDYTGYLLSRAERLAKMAPEAIGALPINRAQFDGEVTARLTRERDELGTILQRGNNPWVQFGGELVGSVDWYDVAALPIDAPLTAGAKLTAYVGKQFLLGASLSVPGVMATQAQGERLGFDPGNPVAQVAAGGVLQGTLAGIIGGVLRIPEYVATRVAAEKAARPDGVSAIELEAATDAAEEALEAGRVPSPPRPGAEPVLPPITPDAPTNWEQIRNGIFAGESGGDYDALFGYSNRSGGPFADVKLTEMTVDHAIEFSSPSGTYGQWVKGRIGRVATPMGAYQIVGTTLRAAKAGLGLTGDEVMTPALQEKLGQWIYRAQGTGAWEGYRGPRSTFVPSGGGAYTGTGRRSPRSTMADEVSTPGGTRVKVEYQVVDMGSLRAATGDLQPRDRSRAASDEQIAKIAARLDPALLMPGPLSDRGAPLVGPDGIIESGNGRVQGLARAAEINPEAYAAYVQAIRDEGFDVPEGMTRPVLIARRTTDLDQAGRIQVIRESNTSAIGRMSGTEQARFDADGMTQPVFDAYRPGKTVGSLENAAFVQRFMAGMTPEERAPLMQANGRLSADGLKRIQSALFARAFDAKDLLTLVAETESRAITRLVNMLENLAPDWAYFRSLIEAGFVRPEFDITAPLTEAVRIIANARASARDGQSVIAAVRDRLAQTDMFTPRDPMIEAIIDVFYKGDRARGIEASEEILKRYASKAAAMGRADAADLADDAASPVDVLRRAITDEEGGSPYAPLPARAGGSGSAPDVEAIAAAVETFDPARFTDGTASPAVQAADDAALDELVAQTRPTAELLTEVRPQQFVRTLADAQPFDDFDTLYAKASKAQDRLATVGPAIADDLGVTFKNPGLKDRAEAEAKVARKSYDSPRRLTDISRAGFVVDDLAQAEQVVDRLAKEFDLIDEGWYMQPTNYIDRKVILRHPDGMLSEVQLWTTDMWAAKKKGTPLYKEWRSLPEDDPARVRLAQEQDQLYLAARGVLSDIAFSGDGKSMLPKLSPNQSSMFSADPRTRAVFQTSPASTGVQSAPGRSMASAKKSPDGLRNSTAGRASQSVNASSFMGEVPPSSGDTSNMGGTAGEVNAALAEARAALAPDDILTFGEGDDLVRVSVADAIRAIEQDRSLEQVMEACKIGRARA